MTVVTLTDHEVALVRAVGEARRASAVALGRPARYGFNKDDPTASDINAAGGELASALLYRLPWTGCYYRELDPKPADIGRATEVRTREVHPAMTAETMDLLAHPEDPDDWNLVLVVGTLPTYEVVGHISGARAKRQGWWKDPSGRSGASRPAYFVPQHALTPPAIS